MISTPVRNIDEIARAINAFAVEPNGALLMTGPQKAILGLAHQHRLPTMFGTGKLVAEGLLMFNGPDLADIIRGASPMSIAFCVVRGPATGHQPQDRQGHWHRNSGNRAGACRRGS
jgi:hypothetical protein